MTDTPVAEMSFEDAMKELEAVVNKVWLMGAIERSLPGKTGAE